MDKVNINQIIKKIGLSFFALFLAFAFTACANEDTKNEAETTNEVTDNGDNKNENQNDKSDRELVSTDDDEEKSNEDSVSYREIFVTADYVKDVIDGKTDIDDYVIAEATWGEADASEDYLKNHIPGAIHINTDTIEEGPLWNFKNDDEFVKSMLDYGIDKDTTVYLYGPDSGAPRVALAYLIEGVENVKLIDGGLKAWMDKGYETEEGENKAVAKDDFKGEYPAHPELLVSLDEAKKDIENENSDVQYVSTRTYEEYIGETSGYSYIPKAGELPGAIYGHDEADYKNPDGTYISYDDMVKMLENEGVDTNKDIVFYCGTGWRAALLLLKFYEQGIETKLFDGGWNEWQMHDELPVQLGDPKEDAQMTTVGDLSNDKASKE
ncbi:sulfurtransferase [Anaerococcus cruorum]|uniref:sulfurtransferase n=1 Tax=Anaerococcus sp. WGS1596 TaxID=3366806 RepID=UPI00372D2453